MKNIKFLLLFLSFTVSINFCYSQTSHWGIPENEHETLSKETVIANRINSVNVTTHYFDSLKRPQPGFHKFLKRYDKHGNLVELVDYKQFYPIQQFKYTSKGLLTEKRLFSNQLKLSESCKMKYNNKGNMVKSSCGLNLDDSAKKTFKTTRYKYKDNLLISEKTDKDIIKYAYDEGKIHEVISKDYKISYRYNTNDKMLEELVEDGDGYFMSKTAIAYDQEGRIIDSSYYSKALRTLNRWQYTHSENGTIAVHSICRGDTARNCNRVTYKYDSRNNLLEHSGGNISWKYEYDANNNVISEKIFEGGTLRKSISFKYDSNNRKIEETSMENFDDAVRYTRTYQYDDKGRRIEDVFSNSKGESAVFTYKYDENGNQTKTFYSNNSVKPAIKNILYNERKYDANGNLVQVTQYKPNGTPFKMEKFTYQFFKK